MIDLDNLNKLVAAQNENARLKIKLSNARRALRDMNKVRRARADALREIQHVPMAMRSDWLLEAHGKLTQRTNELRVALGKDIGNAWSWQELIDAVRKLRKAGE